MSPSTGSLLLFLSREFSWLSRLSYCLPRDLEEVKGNARIAIYCKFRSLHLSPKGDIPNRWRNDQMIFYICSGLNIYYILSLFSSFPFYACSIKIIFSFPLYYYFEMKAFQISLQKIQYMFPWPFALVKSSCSYLLTRKSTFPPISAAQCVFEAFEYPYISKRIFYREKTVEFLCSLFFSKISIGWDI